MKTMKKFLMGMISIVILIFAISCAKQETPQMTGDLGDSNSKGTATIIPVDRIDIPVIKPPFRLLPTIVFSSSRNNAWNFYTMLSDGSNQTKAGFGVSGSLQYYATSSNSGSQVAFIMDSDLYISNVDGTNVKRLTNDQNSSTFKKYPTWNDTDTKIAYQKGSDIWIYDLSNNSNYLYVSNGTSPSWYAGNTLIFIRSGNIIVRYNSLDIQYTSDGKAVELSASYQAKYIAYTHDEGYGYTDLYLMPCFTNDITRVTVNAYVQSPAWSTSGSKIVFTSFRDEGARPNDVFNYLSWHLENGEIYTVLKDGSSLTRLTNIPLNQGGNFSPSFLGKSK